MTAPKQHLEAILDALDAQRRAIEAAPVATAPDFTWIDVYPSNGRNYARVRSDRPIFSGKKLMALGREGSDRHREYQQRIEKRNALAELERRSLAVRELLEQFEQPIWVPPAPEPSLPASHAEIAAGDRLEVDGLSFSVVAVGFRHAKLLSDDGETWFFTFEGQELWQRQPREAIAPPMPA